MPHYFREMSEQPTPCVCVACDSFDDRLQYTPGGAGFVDFARTPRKEGSRRKTRYCIAIS